MKIFPAIDIIDGRAVRLYKGDYNQKTEYGSPLEIARVFKNSGAKYIHIVDLDGAKSGETPNIRLISEIAAETGMFVEVGGGIRSLEVIKKYLSSGVSRVILGTAAVTNPELLKEAVSLYSDKIAVGADILGGKVKIKGWLDDSGLGLNEFLDGIAAAGVRSVICTDISRDGAMTGPNIDLYKDIKRNYSIELTASGGISCMNDLVKLNEIGIDSAIIGKAYYAGAIKLEEALTLQ